MSGYRALPESFEVRSRAARPAKVRQEGREPAPQHRRTRPLKAKQRDMMISAPA
jgi:hypothetical protein